MQSIRQRPAAAVGRSSAAPKISSTGVWTVLTWEPKLLHGRFAGPPNPPSQRRPVRMRRGRLPRRRPLSSYSPDILRADGLEEHLRRARAGAATSPPRRRPLRVRRRRHAVDAARLDGSRLPAGGVDRPRAVPRRRPRLLGTGRSEEPARPNGCRGDRLRRGGRPPPVPRSGVATRWAARDARPVGDDPHRGSGEGPPRRARPVRHHLSARSARSVADRNAAALPVPSGDAPARGPASARAAPSPGGCAPRVPGSHHGCARRGPGPDACRAPAGGVPDPAGPSGGGHVAVGWRG